MAFLILGILLLAMKLAEFGPVGAWSWWLVLLPFGLATAWWAFSDSIGLTQRRAMDKMEQVKAERRNRNLQALGLGPRHDRKAGAQQRIPGCQTRARAPPRTRRSATADAGAAGAEPARCLQSNLSSTAPLLALLAFFANLASTPRV